MSLHINKKILLLILSTGIIGTKTINANLIIPDSATISTYEQAKDGKEKYLEWLFIIKPGNEIKKIDNMILAAVSGFVGLVALSSSHLLKRNTASKEAPQSTETKTEPTLAQYLLEQKSKESSKPSAPVELISLSNAIAAAAIIGCGKSGFNCFKYYQKNLIQKRTLDKILKGWKTHREHLPANMVEFLDQISEIYNVEGDSILTTPFVSEIFQIIEHHIEHQFESRYKKSDDSFKSLETLKDCTDIWKNFK